ncbi:hypothetical protein [Bacillus kexueae]|uniref:hypothetical protein n=1 Tax=Aeribacillus kexueae TaxID=2078952 RepID=UPI001FAFD55D|nr:hypothetical protein [Bacillus kexueae]
MKQVVRGNQKFDKQKKINIIRLELDYELATLFDAMEEKNEDKKKQCIKKLEKLRNEWLRLTK